MKHCLISCLRALQRAVAPLQLTCLALALHFPAFAQEGSGSSRQTQACGDKDAGITPAPGLLRNRDAQNKDLRPVKGAPQGAELRVFSLHIISRLGPAEGSWVVVDGVNVVTHGLFQLAGRAVDTSPDLMFRQIGKEPLDLIDPRRSE